MTRSVAVVGGGPAGAAAAWRLRDADCDVTLYEASAALGGRAATRRRGDCRYDPGANYVTDDDERAARALDALGTDDRADVTAPIWTFDATGAVGPGRGGDGHRWTYRGGIATVANRFAARSGAEVRRLTPVDALDRRGDGWRLRFGGDATRADAVVAAVPAPALAATLVAGEWDAPLSGAFVDAAEAVPYRPVVTAALHYPFRVERPYYALLNTDREHAVGWIGRESCKPGRVPADESLLVVQMGNGWSAEHLDAPDADVMDAAGEHAAALVDDDRLRDPDWAETARWPHALPDGELDPDLLAAARDASLSLAGDWVAGAARVHAAIGSGLEAGADLAGRCH